MKKYKAIYYHGDTEVKKVFDVVKVVPHKKYKYFEIVQVTYHHEFITIAYYSEIDRIVLKDADGHTVEYRADA